MLYNLSEFMELIKQDIGIRDIVLPIDDSELVKRFGNSALKEFSVRAPRIEIMLMGETERVKTEMEAYRRVQLIYEIPKYIYEGSSILGIPHIDIARPLGYSDLYVPQGSFTSPDMLLGAIADIKMMSAVSASMGRAPTYKFITPNRIIMYNGWAGGVYEVELALMHDISLSTIQPTAFTQLLQLATLDMKEFLYNEIKRLQNLDVGIGNIELKIDSWENASSDKRALLDKWDEEGANLDVDSIIYF